jgi:hypothetical protein
VSGFSSSILLFVSSRSSSIPLVKLFLTHYTRTNTNNYFNHIISIPKLRLYVPSLLYIISLYTATILPRKVKTDFVYLSLLYETV